MCLGLAFCWGLCVRLLCPLILGWPGPSQLRARMTEGLQTGGQNARRPRREGPCRAGPLLLPVCKNLPAHSWAGPSQPVLVCLMASRHESVWKPELTVAEGQWEPPPAWHKPTAASLMGSRAQSAQGPAPWPTGTLDGPENKHQSEGETEKASFRQPAVTDSAKTR